MDLDGKVAIVTGGGRGIGQSIALALAQEGADVLVADLDPATAGETVAEIGRTGRRAVAHGIDLCDVSAIPAMIDRAVSELGRADILVNNAGVEFGGTVFEVTAEQWDRHFAVNVRAMFFATQAVARWMKDNGGGAVVNIASVQGAIFSGRYIPYTASKSSVRGLTGSCAVALAPYGIRVNAVAPGWCDTAMNKIADDPAAVAERLRMVPLRRVGQPLDMAQAVVYLAGDRSSYVTGQVLTVDGGRTLGAPPA
jgi:2-dehydro-3-deoxy-D-gluconate 5-dehydrogenase